MKQKFILSEIEIKYKNRYKFEDRVKISSSKDANKIFHKIWSDSIEFKESVYMLLLDASNTVLGFYLTSMGGRFSSNIDLVQIMQVVLKSNAVGFILAHNHPSGNKYPSPEDIKITRSIQEACKLMGVRFMDHLIITKSRYSSFVDDSLMIGTKAYEIENS